MLMDMVVLLNLDVVMPFDDAMYGCQFEGGLSIANENAAAHAVVTAKLVQDNAIFVLTDTASYIMQ